MHADLLAQAKQLVALDPGRPRQVSLRRAVSSAYYALFHRLIAFSVQNVLGAAARAGPIGLEMSRWFDHGRMKTVSAWFSRRGSIPPRVASLLGYASGSAVPQDLNNVAATLTHLQEERHRADYDLSYRLSRTQATQLVAQVEVAFQQLESVAADPVTKLFGLLLLTGDRVIASR